MPARQQTASVHLPICFWWPTQYMLTLFHQRDLATADDIWVVRPNVDTLYSRSFLDLSSSGLEITIPEISDRYWVSSIQMSPTKGCRHCPPPKDAEPTFLWDDPLTICNKLWPFYDAYVTRACEFIVGFRTDPFVRYGNNVANIGPLQNHSAGVYVVQYDANRAPGVYPTNGSSIYQAHINVPTPYALSMIRIAIKHQNNDTDVEVVRSMQDQFDITLAPSTNDTSSTASALNLSMFSDPAVAPNAYGSLEEGIPSLGAKLTPYNLPEEPSDRSWINETLTGAGLTAPLYNRQGQTSQPHRRPPINPSRPSRPSRGSSSSSATSGPRRMLLTRPTSTARTLRGTQSLPVDTSP